MSCKCFSDSYSVSCLECDEPGRGDGSGAGLGESPGGAGPVPRAGGHLQRAVGLRPLAQEVQDGGRQVPDHRHGGQQAGETGSRGGNI